MNIFIDADSCPKAVRDLVIRRANKLNIKLILAANRPIPCGNVQMEICSKDENAADDRIVELAQAGDLVITRDVPLAKRLIEKMINVIDDRGRMFNANNINEFLSLRNFKVSLAENGLGIERTASYDKKELKIFADSFDRILTKIKNN